MSTLADLINKRMAEFRVWQREAMGEEKEDPTFRVETYLSPCTWADPRTLRLAVVYDDKLDYEVEM